MKMDAVEYVKAMWRMCMEIGCCDNCPLRDNCGTTGRRDAEKNVEAVERWAKNHHVKTRQSELLKLFPNARMEFDIIKIFPCEIDPSYSDERLIGKCDGKDCWQCRRKYWLEEIE